MDIKDAMENNDCQKVKQLMSKGIPLRPRNGDKNQLDRWMLDLCSIQLLVNHVLHDWKHRASCFRSSKNSCRYKIPQVPIQESSVKPVLSATNGGCLEEKNWLSPSSNRPEVIQLVIDTKKRPVFIFLTDSNSVVMSAFKCNNCVRYVQDQKVSLYYGAYASKHNKENEKALTELMRSLTNYENRKKAEEILKVQSEISEQENKGERTSNKSFCPDALHGFRRLLVGSKASTNGETVGAPLAAYGARDDKIFAMSHPTAPLPLLQGKAYLLGKPLRASISKEGVILATIYDYVFRTTSDLRIQNMNFWNFTGTQEICPLSKKVKEYEVGNINNFTLHFQKIKLF